VLVRPLRGGGDREVDHVVENAFWRLGVTAACKDSHDDRRGRGWSMHLENRLVNDPLPPNAGAVSRVRCSALLDI
jgi:hypothetical protein